MNLATFEEWLARSGEERLVQEISDGHRRSRAQWEQRNDRGILYSWPAWEIRLSLFWEENRDEWHNRWSQCGGILYEGRLIAAKWDNVWERLSETFYDGLGTPYPPYARSSCARWFEIDQDEAIVLGVISENEFHSHMAAFPKEPLLDADGKLLSKEALVEQQALLKSALQELEENNCRHGGLKPGATREERFAYRRQQEQQQAERVQGEYEARMQQGSDQRAERNQTFCLLEAVERSLRENPAVHDERRWDWLCESLTKLTATQYFDEYPNWRARAWIASAKMYSSIGQSADELSCLKRALELNPQCPVKRRIKALERLVTGAGESPIK